MSDAFETIINYYKDYYFGNERYVFIALFCLAYLLIFEKNIREKYALPLVVVVAVVVNPIIYKLVFSKTYMFWRLFQIFSIYLIIGITMICLIKRMKNFLLKLALFIVFCSMIIYSGYGNVFENQSLMEYTEIVNLEKIPDGVAEICDQILELEDEPLVISDPYFCVYARVYSGRIRQLWGRLNFISEMSDSAKEVYEYSLVSGDMYALFEWASKHDYNSVVFHNRISDDYIAAMFGYKEILVSGTDDHQFHLYYDVGIENTDFADMLLEQPNSEEE